MCEHFEGILKVLNLLKQLVSSCVPGVSSNQLKSTGVLALLPSGTASEGLGSAIHSSCVELIQHIVNQAQPFLTTLSPHSKEKKSKEVDNYGHSSSIHGPMANVYMGSKSLQNLLPMLSPYNVYVLVQVIPAH